MKEVNGVMNMRSFPRPSLRVWFARSLMRTGGHLYDERCRAVFCGFGWV